jgi:soluble lytic murein transglycosylase-like protein
MLEGLKKVFARIDDLNTSFRGMGPRQARREKQTFADALNELQKTEVSPDPQKTEPVVLQTKPAPILPMPKMAPAIREIPDYSDLIRKSAAKFKVDPQLVRRVIEVESGFNAQSVSKKGAVGLMQLMPETARELGVTDPYDPAQNIEGGTRYLSMLLEKNGGDLSRALASYNAGPGAVRQYGGIPPFKETQQFVQRVLTGIKQESETEEE